MSRSAPFILFTLAVLFFGGRAFAQSSGYLTEDGAWCWFSDPRAILVNDAVIAGWVTSNGTIEAGRLELADQRTATSELYFRLEPDDHDNPAFVQTATGDVLALYTRHGFKDLFINRWAPAGDSSFSFTPPQFIHPFSEEELAKFPRPTITYANPYRLAAERDRIYCFGRWIGFKPNLMWSDDDGATWSPSKVFITNYPFDGNNRPYVKYFSDGRSKVHIVFTDGHPRDEPTNSVYYAYYEAGGFYTIAGALIRTLDDIPFEPKEASVVYTSNLEEGRAWIADIGQDEAGNPVILYTRSPTEQNHEYWYARYDGTRWRNEKICDSGPWFPQTPDGESEREPHYFGGMSIHPGNAAVVYLSRQVNGVFEIERWETPDGGKTWTAEPITENSTLDNVRPYLPRGLAADAAEVVLWMENQKYVQYTDYRTAIRYYIRGGE